DERFREWAGPRQPLQRPGGRGDAGVGRGDPRPGRVGSVAASVSKRIRSQDVRLDRSAACLLALRGEVPRVLPAGAAGVGGSMGFNPMQPGKVKRGDILMFL